MMFKRYAPVGRCIYCGKTAAEAGMHKLAEEHIIALSLAGTFVLPESSCRACAKHTGADEGHCAGEMFRMARTHFAWRSRKSKRPTSLRAGTSTGRAATWREVPTDQHPPCIILPNFLPPGIIEGRTLDEDGVWSTSVGLYMGPGFLDRMGALGSGGSIYATFIPGTFFRMLAKIAHAYTVAELGLSTFENLLPGIILGKTPHVGHFVGGVPRNQRAEAERTDDLHTLALETHGDLIVVRVRLYARYGAPGYMVVSGRPKPQS